MSADSFVHIVPSGSRCRIAILGFGTVGSAVARRLTGPDAIRGLELSCICDRRAASKRHALPDQRGIAWTSSIDDVLTGDADVVVETIGGVDPAVDWMRRALLAGKSVVTANKQAIAREGPALLALAARQGRQVRFEAAVGGAMPIVRAIGDGLTGDRLTRVVAILNGTTNAVLSTMEATGCSLSDALVDAQARGYAEADPSVDLDGGDASAKLSILCGLAFGLRVDARDIEKKSASAITAADFERARSHGQTIRQISHAEYDRARGTLTAWVAPTAVSRRSVFAQCTGPQNAAVISGCYAGDVTIAGAGAGGDATAVAVISDIVAIARDRAAIVPAPVLSAPASIVGLQPSGFELRTSDFVLRTSDFVLRTSDFAEAV